ncbi:hypothetical protein Ac2012v2_000384 [Leucoagaricus gongylophorus]
MITNARNSAEEQLRTSQELSLLRHSLADELAELSNEFVSVSSDDNDQPTLLEDVETLHRSLKELESVKSYVQVIQHGLKLSESAVSQAKSIASVSTSCDRVPRPSKVCRKGDKCLFTCRKRQWSKEATRHSIPREGL